MMPSPNNKSPRPDYRLLFWIFWAAITIFRLLFANSFGLGVDESHYLLYARHLNWGYFDHPPLVAFLAGLTTRFGDGVFWVRLGPIICSSISQVILWYLALALYHDRSISFWSVILLNLMPYQHLLMVALLPDATLNLFWCSTLLVLRYAVKRGTWPVWIITGVLFGCALLSKYHGVLLAGCLFGYFLTSRTQRFWLKKPQPYVAAMIGGVIFSPNVLWNYRHDWISYAFQLGQAGGDGFRPAKFLAAIGGQFGVWSPIIFGLLIAAVIFLLRQKKMTDADIFCVWTSVPIFVFFCLIGLSSKVLPHWTAAGWWTGSIAVASVVVRRLSAPETSAIKWRRWSLAAAVTGLAMSSLLYAALFWPIAAPVYTWARNLSLSLNRSFSFIEPLKPFEPGFDISNDLFGWQQIAARVEAIRAVMPRPQQTFIFCHRFYMASQLGVYLSPDTAVTTLGKRYDQYRLWFSATGHTGWDALFVVDSKRSRTRALRYRSLFTEMDPDPWPITVLRQGRPAHELVVYRFFGYKGGYEK